MLFPESMKRCSGWLLTMVSIWFACAAPAGEARKPNVVLIISDDHTWSHYGMMGHPVAKTPYIDKMAAEGLLYTRGYSMPVCSPSLASLLTGLMPHQHGITGNDLRAKRDDRDVLRTRLLRNSVILPKALKDAGYLTFQTGKLWNTSYEDIGFTHGMTKERSRHGGTGLAIGREGIQPVHDFLDTAVAEKKPFFIWYAPMMPHDPHTPPERILKKYRGKGPTEHAEKYLAMIEWFDETCGELDGALEQRGLKGDTMIVYLSDNGWDPEQGYAGGRAKLTPYENGVRTPLFIRWPGKVAPLRDNETPVSIVDVVPTILRAADIPLPTGLPGGDLRNHDAMTARNTALIESYRHDIVDIDDPVKSLTSRAVIHGWKKLIVPGPVTMDGSRAKFAAISGVTELYDLKEDPTETNNLAAGQPEEVSRLKAMLDAAWKAE